MGKSIPFDSANPEHHLMAARAYRQVEKQLCQALQPLTRTSLSGSLNFDLLQDIVAIAKRVNELHNLSLSAAQNAESAILADCGSGI